MMLLPCDVFVTRGKGVFARGIRWATRDRGETATEVNHVGAIVEAGDWSEVRCIEALETVQLHSIAEKYDANGHGVAVYRPANLTVDQQSTILTYLHNHVGNSYGYGKIALHLLRKVTGRQFWLHHQTDRWPICSYLIARAWKEAGLDFGCDERLATPDDVHDFCRANPDKYSLVGTRGVLG